MSTDTAALQERVARATYEVEATRPNWESLPAKSHDYWRGRAAALLPIVLREKAGAWDEAYRLGVQDEIDSQGFDGGFTRPNRINPYTTTTGA